MGRDSDVVNNPVFGTVSMDQIEADQKIELTCCLKGNFISINFPSSKRQFLHICEVRAYSGESTMRSKISTFLFLFLFVCFCFCFCLFVCCFFLFGFFCNSMSSHKVFL